MNKIYVFCVIMVLVLNACGDFLKENSQDLLVPKTVENYKEFLYGEGLNNSLVINDYLDVMTDDVEEGMNLKRPQGVDYREGMWSYYTWQRYPEIQRGNALVEDRAWQEYYHRILVANIILNELGNAEGSLAEKNDLAGEAYFLRAWSYFMLANLYGKPYVDEQRAASDFCVPINRNIDIEVRPLTRASILEVYALMEEDIRHSIASFKAAPGEKNIFRPNLATSYLLASRIALFQKKYDETILYADSVFLSTRAQMYDLNKEISATQFLTKENTEILFTYGWSDYYNIFQYSTSYRAFYISSASLLKLFPKNDNRIKKTLCFRNDGKQPRKWYYLASSVYAHSFRLSEAYLNRAEAYAENGKISEALQDINYIRERRIPTDFEVNVTSKEEVRLCVRNERRMELCFEGFRWFDLRRWDRPELIHRYTSAENPSEFKEYKLQKDDPAYTLPVPQKERDMNLEIENIDRPER